MPSLQSTGLRSYERYERGNQTDKTYCFFHFTLNGKVLRNLCFMTWQPKFMQPHAKVVRERVALFHHITWSYTYPPILINGSTMWE